MNLDDTIAAVASAAGSGCRGIVRLSGADAIHCVTPLYRPDVPRELLGMPRATRVSGQLQLVRPLGPLPCDLYVWPGRRSYTRQPVVELHTWGSPPILDAVLAAVCRQGARLAEAGEFTMRAFLAGRLDLTQAEAVLGVIDARDQQDFQTALVQLAGGLGRTFQEVRERLLDLLSQLEAALDFVDEDIAFISPDTVADELESAQTTLQRMATQLRDRGQESDEYRVAVIGWPNVGKSSLVNALAGKPAAIVSPVPGTTRDYVTCPLEIEGLACVLIDTAGLEDAACQIGQAAQSQTAIQQQQAHVHLLCLDATRRLNAWEIEAIRKPAHVPRILVLTKTDRPRLSDLHLPAVETSSDRGEGLGQLRREITQRLVGQLSSEGIVASTGIRCMEGLRRAGAALQEAIRANGERAGEELVAVDVRRALDELGQIVGAVYTDDILDRIFSRFCIGK